MTGRGITAGPNDTAVYQEEFSYDSAGRLWKSTEGDGVAKLYVHNRNGAVTLTIASSGTNLGADTIDQAIARLTNNGANTIGAVAVSGVTAIDLRLQPPRRGGRIPRAVPRAVLERRRRLQHGHASSPAAPTMRSAR